MPLGPGGAKGKARTQGMADVWRFLQIRDSVPCLVN